MNDQTENKLEDLGDDFEVIEDLGSEFEVIEDAAPDGGAAKSGDSKREADKKSGSDSPKNDAGKDSKSGKKGAKSQAQDPTPAAAPLPPGAPTPLSSVHAWTSLGLGLSLAGLFGPWASDSSNFVHGFFIAAVLWYLMRFGLAALKPQRSSGGVPFLALVGLMLVYSGTRLAFAMSGNDAMADTLGWYGSESSQLVDALGAVITLLGAVIALAAPNLGKKKDSKLPAAGAPADVDKQFTTSLLAYLMIFVGMMMPWSSSNQRGVDSILGLLTMVFVVMVIWASWAGMWKHWAAPLVNAKLGLVLFVAPLEALILGLFGLIRHITEGPEGVAFEAWPPMEIISIGGDLVEATSTAPEPFMVYAGGSLLTLLGSCLAGYVLVQGTKAGMQMNKERKDAEIAARKAARESRKSDDAGKGSASKGAGSKSKNGDSKDAKK